MRTVDQRIAWGESNFSIKDGRPWTTDGRPWVREHFFLPAYGFTIWARDTARLCDRCGERTGKVVEWSAELEDELERGCLGGAAGCAGLTLHAIRTVMLSLPRREGKTVNLACLVAERMFNDPEETALYVAAAGEQTSTLFDENFAIPIRANEDLNDACTIRGTKIIVSETNSRMEIADTAHGSITGRGRRIVVIEEARDVPGDVAVRAMQSVKDQSRMLCQRGHISPIRGNPKKCKICGKRNRISPGLVVVISSEGKIVNPKQSWFTTVVATREADPKPHLHLFKMEESSNPDVDEEASSSIYEVFGDVPSLADAVRGEMHNRSIRPGEDILTEEQIAAITDKDLRNAEGSALKAVGFLDTSQTVEKTSLVIAVDDPGDDPWWGRGPGSPPLAPWQLITIARMDVWVPKEQRGGQIDEKLILPHLQRVVPLFLGLQELWVDVRARPWAHTLVDLCNRHERGWGEKVLRYQYGGKEAEIKRRAWLAYLSRAQGGTIRQPKSEQLKEEIQGMTKATDRNGNEIFVDRARKKVHADILSGIVALCGRIWELQIMPPSSSLAKFNDEGATVEERTRAILRQFEGGSNFTAGKMGITSF